jgi:iron complex outermembrane receptor protein
MRIASSALPRGILVSVGVAGGLYSAVAHAQTALTGGTGGELAEIVVTAEKRAETLQSTPISVTAVSGEDLEARGTPSLSDVVTAVPGVTQRSSGPGVTEYEMRGMSSSAGSSPTVGFYLDETPLTAPAAAQWGKVVIDPNLYDVERVEVLRGPQGTLYGSGSMGGTIKIIPHSAELGTLNVSADVQGSGTQGGGPNGRVSAMVNIPLAETLALRLVATAFDQSGWIDRTVVGDFPVPQASGARGDMIGLPVIANHDDVNDLHEVAMRLSATFKPIDSLTITPSIFYQETTSGGLSVFDSLPGTETHYQPYDVAEPLSDRTRMASIVGNYDLPVADIVLSLSEWKRTLTLIQDQSENLAYFFTAGNVYPPAGLGGSGIHEDDPEQQFSGELRIVSQGHGPLQGVLGLFYSNFGTTWNVYAQVPGSLAAFGTTNELNWTQPQTVKQKAVFGEASYAVTNELKVTLGGRYFLYDEAVRTTQSGWVSYTGSDAVYTAAGTHSESGVNPKATISYEPTNDFTVFATVAKGFRPGGGNAPVPVSGPGSCLASLTALGITNAPLFYNSDSVISYELGEKLRLLDRRLTLNASGYHINWSDVQQTVVLTVCGYPFTGNEGRATVDGGEFEGTYAIGGGWSASANIAHAKAQLSENVPSTGGHKGDELQDTPAWTGSAALNYTRALGSDLTLTGRVGATYVGNRIDVTYARNQVPSYTLADARVTVGWKQWSTALFVDNLTNKQASIDNIVALSVNLPTYNRVSTSQPRTVGLQIHYNFR